MHISIVPKNILLSTKFLKTGVYCVHVFSAEDVVLLLFCLSSNKGFNLPLVLHGFAVKSFPRVSTPKTHFFQYHVFVVTNSENIVD